MITAYHVPICPFCQRLEVLLELKGLHDAVRFERVDITVPRDPALLELTGGSTALPVMQLEGGQALKESMVLLDYLEDRFPEPAVRRTDPYERAVENLLVTLCDPLIGAGYRFVMNNDRDRRQALLDGYLEAGRAIDAFLRRYSPDGPWLFDRFGWAETVYTPFFQRFVFVAYYEGIDLSDHPGLERLGTWWRACVEHPAAQQTSDEEVIKLYYDYARGFGNGSLPDGRARSSFVFEPDWRERPWPPKDKYGPGASDETLGLLL